MLKESTAVILARLAVQVDTDGEFEDAIVLLFDETFTPNSAMTFAQVNAAKCTFTGYANSAPLTWTPPYADAQLRGVLLGSAVSFKATADPAGALVGGYAVLNAAGDGILWAEQFTDEAGAPAPRAVVQGQAIVIVPKYVFGRQAA